VQGHGCRDRQVLGPGEVGAAPELRVIQVRRYHCILCDAAMTVGPAELLTRRLYSAAAIAYALALFAISRLSPRAVREYVSPFRVVGATSASRWSTLLRWCSAVSAARLFPCVGPLPAAWSPRRAAERAVMTLASYAFPSPDPPPLTTLAFLGAARAR
jgi:hypothetical protein